MDEVGNPRAFATEEQRVAGGEIETMERDGPAGREEDQPGARVALRQEGAPRGMATDRRPCDIIERGAAKPPVVEQETERLDQIDLDRKAGGQAQQRPGILRDIGFKQSEAQIVSSA